jgi:APA family basic amino acid/polyamine antiporter
MPLPNADLGNDSRHELPRVLDVSHATSIVVGIIIGSGIFLVPREMMAAVGSSGMVYAVWIVGGLLSLCGAMTYAEIAAGRPLYGGDYAFLRDAYGDLTGFLYMWTWIAIEKPASLATIAAGLARVLGLFPVFGFFAHPAIGGILWSQVFAIGVTWLITALNIVSTRESANVQLALTWLKGALIVVIAAFCFGAGAFHTYGGAGWHNFATTFAGARGGFSGFMVALIAALWAYDGWSDVTQMAGEIQKPQRSMPIALIGGIAIVGGLYMLTNAAIQYVLPATAIAGADRPTVDAMRLVAGAAGAALVTLGMAISMAATFVGSSLSGARVTFAASRDGLFFSQLAHVNKRFRTPDVSLIVQAVLATLLLLVIAKFQALFSLAIFAAWLFYGLTASTVFVFRRRDRGNTRPFSMWGYPVVPGVFIGAAGVLVVFSLIDQPRNSVAGALVMLLGVPLYYLLQRRGARVLKA